MVKRVSKEIGSTTLTLETGRMGRQADGSVVVQYGDSVVLVTICVSRDPRPNIDFLPLTVEYREKFYAIGKIPGNFFRREGRPSAKEILSARQIDRPLRPLFPKGFTHEVQIIATIISSDQENNQDILGLIGASAASALSCAPVKKIVSGVRVGYIDGEYVINPTFTQLEDSEINIVVAGSDDDVLMVEGSSYEVSEELILGAIDFAKGPIKDICDLQRELAEGIAAPIMEYTAVAATDEMIEAVSADFSDDILKAVLIADKQDRNASLKEIRARIQESLAERFPESEGELKLAFGSVEKAVVRKMILDDKKRIDGRGPEDIRPITCDLGVLPRAHGSALFTRGQTQSLGVLALGTKMDERMIDDLEGTSFKSYMLDYNFLPFCVGEVRMMRGTSRREIGHGNLAETAIEPVIPSDDVFPYTIRIVSDILESNGSSSMATVCSGSLALMEAGVPIKTAVAGIAMGLIKKDDTFVVLSDILGDEDHLGDMDFKVAGTSEGITAFQMDIKIDGLTLDIMSKALIQAKAGREHILGVMNETISQPREALSKFAPRILTLKIDPDKIGMVIGPGGKVIKGIQEQTGATININDDGTVLISSVESEGGEAALKMVSGIVQDAEVGTIYDGTVKRVTGFGAFVEVLPGKEALVHISELDTSRVKTVEDVVNVGDSIRIKVINIDNQGRIKGSRKAVLLEEQ
jgi:polyribonucleotide nucleotidyltransferase